VLEKTTVISISRSKGRKRSQAVKMRTGVHVSISGGLAKGIDRAVERACETIQIFARTPRRWKGKEWDPEDVDLFVEKRDEAGIYPVVIHTCYLINLASPKEDLRRKSIACLVDDLRRADMASIEYVVIHPGSSSGKKGGAERVREACLRALDEVEGSAQLLVENVAGGGNKVGADFEELRTIVEGTGMGVLLDTCHMLGAGYPIHEQPAEVMDEFQEAVGIERLKAFHLNDSKGEPGSHVDRHEHIGQGTIGMEGFRRIFSDPRIRSVPGILETPQRATDDPSYDKANLSAIRGILAEYDD